MWAEAEAAVELLWSPNTQFPVCLCCSPTVNWRPLGMRWRRQISRMYSALALQNIPKGSAWELNEQTLHHEGKDDTRISPLWVSTGRPKTTGARELSDTEVNPVSYYCFDGLLLLEILGLTCGLKTERGRASLGNISSQLWLANLFFNCEGVDSPLTNIRNQVFSKYSYTETYNRPRCQTCLLAASLAKIRCWTLNVS